MTNPLEDDVWRQIREAYAIVQKGEADELEVEHPTHMIAVEKLERGIIVLIRER